MERYSEYKDCGVQWLGEIPNHWCMQRWRFLLKENKSKNIDCKERVQLQFRYGNIVHKTNQDEDAGALETISKYTVVAPKDIMINGLNLNYDFVSQRVAQVQERGVITSAYISLRPTTSANSKYYTYFLKAMDYKKIFHGMGTGIRLTLSYNELKNQFIPLPSIKEQTAIANYLDSITSTIDEAIAQQQKMIDLLNERKQIIINQAVTKGLDPNVPMKDSGIEWIGEIPQHWNIRRIKYSCSLINEKTQDKIPYIELENIESLTGKLLSISSSEPESICSKFEKNDVLFNKLRPYLAKCIIAEFSGKCTSELLVLRNFRGDNRYFKYLLLSPQLINEINMSTYGAKMPRANWSFIGNCKIPLPEQSVQSNIADYLDSVTSKIDEAIEKKQQLLILLQERKQIIINEVVTGKVKVS